MTRYSGSSVIQTVISKIESIYHWIDGQLAQAPGPLQCRGCGRCCDLQAYGHRLYVTSPEWLYLLHHCQPAQPDGAMGGCCPYNDSGLCTIYRYRFAGCRIFHCQQDQDRMSQLSEAAVRRFKALCQQYRISYRYVDLIDALKGQLSDIDL